jgi:hypothetical protein
VVCPFGGITGAANTAGYTTAQSCAVVSKPVLENNIIWGNRSFHITTAGNPAVITLTPPLNQAGTTGACPTGATVWDIGVYGDSCTAGGTCGSNHGSGFSLHPTYTLMDDPGDYGPAGNHNIGGTAANFPGFTHPYCNGSRVPPEIASQVCSPAGANPNGNANAPGCIRPGALGITTPPGIPDNNPFYENFTLTPAATVDEGNNWINMFYGPLSVVNASIAKGATGYNQLLGNYIPTGAPVAGAGSPTHPAFDFFGNPRPNGPTDLGAVLVSGSHSGIAAVQPALLPLAEQLLGAVGAQTVTVSNNGAAPMIIRGFAVGTPGVSADQITVTSGDCPIGGAALAPGASCKASATFRPNREGPQAATLKVILGSAN